MWTGSFVLHAVSFLSEMGYSNADIARMVLQQPTLLMCKPERYQAILSLMQDLGMSEMVRVSEDHNLCRI